MNDNVKEQVSSTMTEKEIAEIVLAFDKGEAIQSRDTYVYSGDAKWYDVTKPAMWNFWRYEYRKKPYATVTPYTRREFIEAWKAHRGIRHKTSSAVNAIGSVMEHSIRVFNYTEIVTFEKLAAEYLWEDNTPCGLDINPQQE